MMLLTDEQLHLIRQIIRTHHTAIIASIFGPKSLSPDEIRQLELAGVPVAQQVASIDEAYRLGHAMTVIDSPTAATMNLQQFREYVEENPIRLTDAEERAVSAARRTAAEHVRNLSAKIELDTGRVLNEAEQRDAIRERTVSAIERRQTIGELKTELGKITKDYDRDWSRVAITELQAARQQGQADRIRSKHGDDPWVFKRPMPDACKSCKRLHLGPDGHPRIVRLSALTANGTNVGRKQADWQPTVGPVHPYCQCELVHIPDGWGFDENGDMVPGGEFGVRYGDDGELERALVAEDELQKSIKTKGRIRFQGMTIQIESPIGSVRRWTDRTGQSGETRMQAAYGFIEGTRGARQEGKDEYDCFVGANPNAPFAFVVHQMAPPEFTRWDEDKAMLGFESIEHARNTYLIHYNDPRFLGSIAQMPIDEFREKVMRTGLPGEDGMVKADSVFDGFVLPTMVEIPEWMGLLLWATELGKGAGHKYIRRVPTGNPARPYRYYYTITGGHGLGHHEEIQQGSAFKMKHADKEGHFHVTHADGDKIKIRHDESGHEAEMDKQAFAQMLHQHHAEAINAKRSKLKAERKAAKKHGSKKQQQRLKEEQNRFVAHFGAGEGEKKKKKAKAAGLVASDKVGPHADRMKLGELGGIEGAAKLQTFRTKAEARAAAQSIGWPNAHAQPLKTLAGQKLPGGAKLGKWVLMEGDGKIVSQTAFSALQDMPAKKRPKPEALTVEKEPEEPKSPDSLPARVHGGHGKVVDMITGTAGIDIGALDPDESGVREHFMASHGGIVSDAEIKRAKSVKEMMVATLRAAKVKTWRDVATEPKIGNLSVLEHFTMLPQLEEIRLPDTIAERHLTEDQYQYYQDQYSEYQQARGGDDSEKEPEHVADEDLDFDPEMFRSMAAVSRFRVVPGTQRKMWRDASGAIWIELITEVGKRLEKAGDRDLLKAPARAGDRWRWRYFEKALIPELGSVNSLHGRFNVVTGGRGFDIAHNPQVNNQQRGPAGYDPLKTYRDRFRSEEYVYGRPARDRLLDTRGIDLPYAGQPVDDTVFVERYNQITTSVLDAADENRERLEQISDRRTGPPNVEPIPANARRGKVTVRKRGLGEVELSYAPDRFSVRIGKSELEFPSLSAACDHVWCKQHGYESAAVYKSKTGRNKVPSGAGWKFWGLTA